MTLKAGLQNQIGQGRLQNENMYRILKMTRQKNSFHFLTGELKNIIYARVFYISAIHNIAYFHTMNVFKNRLCQLTVKSAL